MMNTTNTNKITGCNAITLAERFGLTLNKYADQTDDTETRAAGITVEVAREVARQDPSLIWLDIATVVAAHGEQEGRDDYAGRALEVSRGAEPEPESWAWPFAGADDAYINAVGVESICDDMGLSDGFPWDEISDAWLAAFRRGYEAAHDAAHDAATSTPWAAGDRVEGGEPGTEDHDTGRVIEVDGTRVHVAWDTLVTAWHGADELRPWADRS